MSTKRKPKKPNGNSLVCGAIMELIRPPTKIHELRIWVMAMLRLKHSSYSTIASELGISRQVVNESVRKPKSKRIEQAIAAKIGYTPELIWPERYRNESVVVPAGKRKSTRKKRGAQ